MVVVLVHGWSVTSTDTYGALGKRLETDSRASRIPPLTVREVFLAKYVSFSDEVRLEDISRAFEAAVQRELEAELAAGEPLAIITHSTGGPIIRDWWNRYYRKLDRPCPMRHLIMLAPANFGSALAQLGKTRIADLKSSIRDGIDPGVGVLDWLEHGSPESWALNKAWIHEPDPSGAEHPLYQFVLTGQTIDRHWYDHANAYTGELGSDGVVRVAAANLNATYIRVTQADVPSNANERTIIPLRADAPVSSCRTAFALIRGRSHSGDDKGILRSIGPAGAHPTYRAIIRCLKVGSQADYQALADAFEHENVSARNIERFETVGRALKREYFHDAHSLIIARIRDHAGYVPERLDFKFTGTANSPDNLPRGMFVDIQRNRRDTGTLTFYLNADAALGTDAVVDRNEAVVRPPRPGLKVLGLLLYPRPRDKYVGYAIGQLRASMRNLGSLIKPDQPVLLDIELKRIVRRGTLDLTTDMRPRSFKGQRPGKPLP